MNTYTWRKNFTASILDQEKVIRGKLAFKTKEVHWLETHSPVIVLVSIHSSFHEIVGGDLKMNALITTIKNHVKGQITVLLSDRAHLRTMSLSYAGNHEKALQECVRVADALKARYRQYFEGCHVVYWHSFIYEDERFAYFLNFLKHSREKDTLFRSLLYQDAMSTYTNERKNICPDKDLYIEKAIEDLLEQGVSLFVLANKGYRFQFYPGRSYDSINYINEVYLQKGSQIDWIDVFLSIEKKTITPIVAQASA